MQLFLRRHPNIARRTPEFVTNASAKVSPADIISWFNNIEEYLTSRDFLDILQDPNRIINGDETSFQLNPKNKTVFALRGSRNVYDVERTSSKVNITTMFSFFASGETIPPTIIYPYKTIPKSVAKSVPPKWGIAKSENGWMTTDVFRDYIKNVLNPHLERNKVKKPVIFITDRHVSHINIDTSTMCREMGIILIALYPNVTRIMQPADVAAFKPLKNGWTKTVEQFRRENPNAAVTVNNFASVLQDCLRNSLTVKSIQNGFKASGLFPWNYNAINFDKCLGTSAAASTPTLPQERIDSDDELQVAKRTLEKCAEYIGNTRIKKFKSDFVCFENVEEQVLHHIYTALQSNHPEIVESVTTGSSTGETFCNFDYSSTPEVTLVSTVVQGELSVSTYESTSEQKVTAAVAEELPGPSVKPLKDFLNVPPPLKRSAQREYKSKRYHVLTSDEFIEEFKLKEEEKSRLEGEKQQRKIARKERKLALEQEKQKKAQLKLLKVKHGLQKENLKAAPKRKPEKKIVI